MGAQRNRRQRWAGWRRCESTRHESGSASPRGRRQRGDRCVSTANSQSGGRSSTTRRTTPRRPASTPTGCRRRATARSGPCLELGCGGGNTALHLKRRFRRLLLTDLSPEMLAVSRALNPECEHQVGDMRTLRLGRSFDAVFVHDAVCYMTTEADLRRAMETAWAHCRPGGAVLFQPDYVRENFRAAASAGGCDEPPPSGSVGGVRAGVALPGVGLGPRSGRYGVPRRLRVPAARARRVGPLRARAARRGPVCARPLAGPPRPRSGSSPAASRSWSRAWSRAGTRCSWGAGRADAAGAPARHRPAPRRCGANAEIRPTGALDRQMDCVTRRAGLLSGQELRTRPCPTTDGRCRTRRSGSASFSTVLPAAGAGGRLVGGRHLRHRTDDRTGRAQRLNANA